MQKLQGKIMSVSFGKLFKRWIIAVLCVVLLGGGVSTALLMPQIRETVTAVQTVRQQKGQWEHDAPGDGYDREEDGEYDREEEHKDRFEVEDILRTSVSRPSAAAILSMGVTALLCGLLALGFWLLVAAWLYQAAVRSGMSGPLWGLLGLCGNVFAAALFAVVRSFLKKRYLACGNWQDKTAVYCTVCGSAMRQNCPDCGAECPTDARFCPACGKKRKDAGTNGETEC